MKKNILKMKRMKELRKKIQKKRKMIKSGSGSIRMVNSTELMQMQSPLLTLRSTNSKRATLYMMVLQKSRKLTRRKLTPKITGSVRMA